MHSVKYLFNRNGISNVLNELRKKLNPNQNILAVSKLQPVIKIEKLYSQGQVDFGENYVQEALEKIEQLKDLKIRWHLIGPLQKNKVKYLKNHFAFIHSVNSLEIARLISDKAEKINYIQKIFLQINISNESNKSGFSIEELSKVWAELCQMKHIKIIGLMTMPPLQNDPLENQPLFENLKKLADKYQLTELSMGTSHDYEVALKAGSTWIRLGTVLFGERAK